LPSQGIGPTQRKCVQLLIKYVSRSKTHIQFFKEKLRGIFRHAKDTILLKRNLAVNGPLLCPRHMFFLFPLSPSTEFAITITTFFRRDADPRIIIARILSNQEITIMLH
jgi:hypothetical protein